MGVFGVRVFDSDTALDVKQTVTQLLRLPIDTPAILTFLKDLHPPLADPVDDDYSDAWLAVAVTLHKQGRSDASVDAIVRDLLAGRDLSIRRELGASDEHLVARKKVLADVAGLLAQPVRRASSSRALTTPQKLVLETGEVWAFATQGGLHPLVGMSWESQQFVPDGRAAFVVLDSGHSFGYLARYVVARIECEITDDGPVSVDPRCRVFGPGSGVLSRPMFGRLGTTRMSRVSLDREKVESFLESRHVRRDRSALLGIRLTNALSGEPLTDTTLSELST